MCANSGYSFLWDISRGSALAVFAGIVRDKEEPKGAQTLGANALGCVSRGGGVSRRFRADGLDSEVGKK